MESGFPRQEATQGLTLSESVPTASASKLEVVRVGNFEASFVPTQKDFSRLDERFRLPKAAWKLLPAYESYGFAVFKLKPGAMKVTETSVHKINGKPLYDWKEKRGVWKRVVKS